MCHSWIRPLWLKNKLAILEDALCWLKNTNILTMGTSKLSVLTSTSGTIASFSLWEGVRSWSSLKKVSVLALKCHFWIWPPPGLNLDLNLTPSLIHFHFSTLKRGASRKAGRAIFQTALKSDTGQASVWHTHAWIMWQQIRLQMSQPTPFARLTLHISCFCLCWV